MVVVEEYYDKDDVENRVYEAIYEVGKDAADSEQDALDFVTKEEKLVSSDFGTIQLIAGEARDEEAYYKVTLVFSKAVRGPSADSELRDVNNKNAVEVNRTGRLGKLLDKLGI